MGERSPSIRHYDEIVTQWMADNGILLLRLSVGVVFLWFGFLKFFPALSPAEDLALRTIRELTFGLVPSRLALTTLAAWETLIGVGLIAGVFLRAVLFLLWLQMVGAVMPLFLFPDVAFAHVPFVPTLEGQYILKNVVLVSAGIVIGATVRGGRLVPEPEAEESKGG